MMTIDVTFDVKTDADGFLAELRLPKNEFVPEYYSHLCFSLLYPLEPHALVGGVLEERQGDWHRIRLSEPYDGQGERVLSFTGKGAFSKATDYPYGVYLESGSRRVPLFLARPVCYRRLSAPAEPRSKAALIPHCQQMNHGQSISFPTQIRLQGEKWNAAWLQRLMTRLDASAVLNPSASWCATAYQDVTLPDEFQLVINADGALLRYRTEQAFSYGQAYLFQYLLQWQRAGRLAACTVAGAPEFDYRGVHLDVVRHFFSAASIIDWLDIFALFHFNALHWHLTDDDGWRVPSRTFPALTEVGAWRGPDEVLPPQMGSGAWRYGGCYQPDEIGAVLQRAGELGVSVIPELDIPGHARALLKALPHLVEVEDRSEYRSVQHHNDNVLNPAFGDTMNVLKTLLDEWCELFPGAVIHVGADEVPKGVWQRSPAALDWAEQHQRPVSDLLPWMLSELEDHLQKHGRTMAGWEEVRDGRGVSKATWVFSWQGTNAGLQAAQAGHPVVMTPAQYCYLDLAKSPDFAEPGYVWAGTLSFEQIYHYQPLQGLSPDVSAQIRGVQYCLWSELLETDASAEYMWFPRLLAGAQVVWGGNTSDHYGPYREDAQAMNELLCALGIAVSSEI